MSESPISESRGLVFRQAALDRLSSPDQLDRLISITSPLGWLALAAVGLLCVAALVWSVLGDIPTRIGGRGILVSEGGGVIDATTNAAGTLVAVHVHTGDRLHKGDLVADLLQPAARQTLDHAREQVADLQAEYARLDDQLTRELALRHDALLRQRLGLAQVIIGDQQRVDYNRQTLAALQEPAAKSLVTTQRLQDLRQGEQDAEQDIKRINSELIRLDVDELDAANHRADELTRARLAIAAAERHVSELADQFSVDARIVAPADGEVIEIKASEGTYIGTGVPVASLQTGANGLDVVLFVPAEHGKKIKPGMQVDVEPTTVKREDDGTMIGRVASIADFPATEQGMEAVLRNPDLVREFSRGAPPYAARVALLQDGAGRYLWTSHRQPDVTITAGTLVSAEVTTAHQHPLALVLPMIGGLFNWGGTGSR